MQTTPTQARALQAAANPSIEAPVVDRETAFNAAVHAEAVAIVDRAWPDFTGYRRTLAIANAVPMARGFIAARFNREWQA